MRYLFYLIVIFIIYLTFLLLKQLKKNILIMIICSFLIVYFILNPATCISSTIAGVKIFFTAVFPSLFSFLILCNILINYDGVAVYSNVLGKFICHPLKLPKQCSFVLIMSALCGYPLGAKYSCELYDDKLISKDQFARLINIASNSSPLFLVGTVGTIMLHSTQIGYVLLISNYLSCILMGLILPVHEKIIIAPKKINSSTKTNTKNFGLILKNSVDNAIQTSLMVGGYITLFSMIIDIIKNNAFYNIVLSSFVSNIISKNTLNGTILGLIEITKGSYMISSANISMYIKIFIINFFAGFSGLSIISQVSSFLSKYSEINFGKYVYRKLIQGIFSGFLSVIFIQILFSFSIIKPVFAINIYQNSYSIVPLTITFIILIILPYIFFYTKKLFHVS